MTKPKLTARQIREALPHMPFNSLLGLKVKRVHRDGVTIECDLRPELLNGYGVLHGGVTATLADVAVGIAIHRHLGGYTPITTVELKVNYFRPVKEGKVFARAYLLRMGSSICVGRVEVADAKKNLIGAAMVTYMIVPARG